MKGTLNFSLQTSLRVTTWSSSNSPKVMVEKRKNNNQQTTICDHVKIKRGSWLLVKWLLMQSWYTVKRHAFGQRVPLRTRAESQERERESAAVTWHTFWLTDILGRGDLHVCLRVSRAVCSSGSSQVPFSRNLSAVQYICITFSTEIMGLTGKPCLCFLINP